MKAKGIVLLIIITSGLLALYWWGARTPANETPVSLKIAVSTTPLSSPVIIARELEIFKQFNLDIELIPLRGGHLCFTAMLNGEAELATSSETVIMFNSFKRDDFKLLASFVESDNDLKLLTTKDKQAQTGTRLNDLRVGMVKASASEFFADAFLIFNGEKNRLQRKVFMTPQDLAPALLAGEVDAISIWEPFGYKLIEEHGDLIYQYPSKGSYNLSFNLVSNTVNAERYRHPYTRVLQALKVAQDFIHQHPDRAKQIISSYLNISLDELEWVWNDYIFRLSLNNSLISNLQTQARWAIESGLVDNQSPPNFRQLLDDAALKRALDN